MNDKLRLICLIAFSLCALVIVGCGGGEIGDSSTATPVADDHEGHDHGPGEHPESASTIAEDWCAEHAVPESECTQCNPALIAQFKETGDWCGPHDLPESHCRLCNPGITFPQEGLFSAVAIDLTEGEIGVALNFRDNASVCATDGALIQFASSTTAERAGISVQPVLQSQRGSNYEAPAEIVFDETRTSAITSSVSALITKWLVSPGDEVAKGAPLAILESPEVARLRSELTTRYAMHQKEQRELERHRELKEKDLISDADFETQIAMAEQARAEYLGTRGMLLSAGLDETDLTASSELGSSSNRFALRAPMNGLVIERVAKLGELLDAGSAFATIGDPGAMWIEAQFTESQLREIDLGHQLVFSSDGRGMNRVGGEIIWVSRFLDPHTRTGTVRARIVDPAHTLRAGEFGRASVVYQGTDHVALVLKDAVQWEGCCNVVFVKETVDRFRPRKVRLIGNNGPYYQVEGGVMPGQEIVVGGAFLLKTELKKSSIGAGCCGLEPVG